MGIKLAIEAAREGAVGVVAAARILAKLDDAEVAVRALGLKIPVLKVVTDIRDRAQCDAVAKATFAHLGRIDALVNSDFTFALVEKFSTRGREEDRRASSSFFPSRTKRSPKVRDLLRAEPDCMYALRRWEFLKGRSWTR